MIWGIIILLCLGIALRIDYVNKWAVFRKGNMKKKSHELEFISMIRRDGSGADLVPELVQVRLKADPCFRNEEYELTSLSITHKTYIASGFNSYVVKLK